MLDKVLLHKKAFSEKLDEQNPPDLDGLGLVPKLAPAVMLPGLGPDYIAAATPDNGNIVRIWFIMAASELLKPGGKRHHGFFYVDMFSGFTIGQDDDGLVFTFSFTTPERVLVIVRGRHLELICDYISLHRMAWIRVADAELSPDDPVAVDDNGKPLPVPFITSITIVNATGEIIAGGGTVPA
jgi:hypothetical protein